jgi:hypothetical protein
VAVLQQGAGFIIGKAISSGVLFKIELGSLGMAKKACRKQAYQDN